MAIEPKDILMPKGRPSLEQKKQGQGGRAVSVVLSLALHVIILLAMFPVVVEFGSSGGTGWADQIEIRSSRDSSSGLQGDPGSTVAEVARARRSFDVSIVYAPPPEPEEYFPEDEPEPEEEPIEEELVEEDAEIDEAEDDPLEEDDPEGVQSIRQVEAEVPTEAIGEAAGEGGMSNVLAGSPRSTGDRGLGSGNADTSRLGTFVPGGQLRQLLNGWTLIGTNGFADGSVSNNQDHRDDIPWNIYYGPGGRVEARFQRYGSRQAHGARGYNWYSETGRWTIEGDQLCQRITHWGGGGVTCFEVHRDGDRIAMYYAYCRGVHRCHMGRLGPEGIIRPGRRLRDRS